MLTVLSENEVGREEYLQLTDDDIAEIVKSIGARRKLINLRKTDTLVSHHACTHDKITLHMCVIQRNANQQSASHMDKSDDDDDDDDQWCSQVDLDFENSTLKVISSEDEVR